MNNTLTLYVPKARNLTAYAYTKRMARRFGGATITDSTGAWINGEGELEIEEVQLITSYFGHGKMMAAHVMIEQFRYDLFKAGEEAVMVVLNGEATIV